MDVTFNRLDVGEHRTFRRKELMSHGHEMLGYDVQARVRHEVVDIRHATCNGIFDGNHAEIRLAACDGREGIFKCGTRHASKSGKTSREAKWEFAPGSP